MKTHIQNLILVLAVSAGVNQAIAQVLTNIVVSPANPTIVVGSNQQFVATGYYNNGSSGVLTNGGGTASWTAVSGMPAPKNGAACAAVNGHLYVVSGAGFNASVFDYNPASNVWSTKTPLPSNYAYAGAAGIGNKLYFMGGCENSDCSSATGNELLIYDTLTSLWTNGATFQRRSLAGVGVINGKIYVTGGQNSAYIGESALQIYDPASNLWTTAQSMPIGRLQCGATVINGKLYVVGGYDGNPATPFGSLVVYDPTTDSWTTKTSMPTPRLGLGAASVGGLLYAIDGVTASGTATNLVEVYNPATDSWSTGAPTLIAHNLAQPVTINGTIYLAGSSPQNNAITNAESYTPQNSLWSSSSPTMASINTNGVATGLTAGTTTIKAISGSVSNSATLTVVSFPVITMQPTNNTVPPNGVNLSVTATGGGLSYQWQLNGTNITGATGATLPISNVTLTNFGVYTVIISNLAGTITSQTAIVSLADLKMFAGFFVYGPIGTNYVIQSKANLTNVWTTRTNLALPSQPYIYIDYSSPTNPQQFYKAMPQ